MSTTVPVFTESGLARSQRRTTISLPFAMATGTGVNTFTFLRTADTPKVLAEGGTGSALTAITQDTVDALFDSTNEVVVSAAFGTTAMVDNDTVAFVLDCDGQIDNVNLVKVSATIATTGTASTKYGEGTKTALTNVAITAPQVFVTANGNLAGRANITNISAAGSAGYCVFEIDAILK